VNFGCSLIWFEDPISWLFYDIKILNTLHNKIDSGHGGELTEAGLFILLPD